MNNKNNIHGNISFNDSSNGNNVQLTNKQNKENNINKPTYNIKYVLNEKEKKQKERKEETPRYGLRKIMEDENLAGKLIVGTALVRLDTEITIKGEKYLRFLNVHDQKGQYLSDHIHVKKSDIIGRINTTDINRNELDPLVYIIFSGQPYNYNENRLDGLSIDTSIKAGGVILLSPQTIVTTKYMLKNDYKFNYTEQEVNSLNDVLLSYSYEELLYLIEFTRYKINNITRTYLVKDFIYNYVIYNYFMEISHKNLYHDTIDLYNVDINALINISALLLNILHYLQKSCDTSIKNLFQHIGYIITSMQDIHNFEAPNAKGNGEYRLRFEPMINKTNTWQVVEYRKQNLKLDWRQIPDKNSVYMDAFKSLDYHLDDITDYLYNKLNN